mmetsp:Transcript_22702/g.22453  ORF Transcript_22702/g.22453 Transcript_22702/m.22453 type:complete len:593 (+) Transcript_22702:160-1938(+)
MFKEREEIADMGQNLYRELISNTSNKGQTDRIRQDFQKSKTMFIDQQFPAESTSLIKDPTLADFHTQRLWRSFVWKRAEEIFKQPIKVFNNIDPNDIQQGSLGDCYFLSTLSAIAEFPKRIEQLFDTQDYQPSGCYTVNICDMGVWTDYVVDDYFPCTADGKIAFSGPHIESGISELWVLLLEKAWAKRFGSYWAIDAGFTEDALRDLTGGPCETVFNEDEEMWDKIFNANKEDWIITAASSGEEGNGDAVNEMGLVTLHAYAVIDAQVVRSKRGQETILQIRNPWGSQEWQGDWSDQSDLWTPELKKKLGWSNSDDGTFWMAFDDFARYFSSVTICRIHDSYHYEASHHTQKTGQFAVYKVTLSQPGQTYFITTQMDSRRFAEEDGYEYSPVRIIAGKVNPKKPGNKGCKLQYISGLANAYQRDVWSVADLEAGTYLVYVEIDWLNELTDQYGFSVYSASPIKLEDVTFQEKNFLQDIYTYNLAKQDSQPRSIGDGISFYTSTHYGAKDDGKFMEGFLFDCIRNKSRNTIIELEVIHKSFDNMELLAPFEGGDSYKVKLKPGEKAVVVKKQISLVEETSVVISMRKKIIPI